MPRPPAPPLSDDTRAKILELGRAGHRATEVARMLRDHARVRVADVRNVLREAGLIRRGASPGPDPRSRAAQAAELVAGGMTPVQAAERVGITRQAVHEYLTRHGIPVADEQPQAGA